MKMTFWFWFFTASFIASVTLFVSESLYSRPSEVFCMGFPALSTIGFVFWMREKSKSSILTNLLSMAFLVFGYCFTTWITQILSTSIIEFFRTVPITDSVKEIVLGIYGEFQTAFFTITSAIQGTAAKKTETTFIWPFTAISITMCFLLSKTFWNLLMLFKKSSN